MLKNENRLKLLNINLNFLKVLIILFITFIILSTSIAIYYLTADPPDGMCLMCVGCPCPYRDFIIAKNYYLNYFFPISMSLNTILIIICSVLIPILKLRYYALKVTTRFNSN
jgi:hypothetical protein